MKLLIKNTEPLNLNEFIKDIVIPTAIDLFLSIIDRRRYATWENYLQKAYNKQSINIDKILLDSISNLEYKKIGNDYEISINPNVICSNIPAKLIDICALINYGNLSISPYPIFDILFERLGEMISDLYIEYTLGGN